jgi:hypothetical protein
VTAYDPTEWHDLFVATAGASAALAGLVFVAVSINLERILKLPGLPERALETILLLLVVLIISIVGLVPGQASQALGLEVFGVGAICAAGIAALPIVREAHPGPSRNWVWGRWVLRLMGTVPFVVGGLSILFEGGGGLYWVFAGIVLAIAGAVANAWVLLVEILR